MKYGYEFQPDGTKNVHVFAEESSRAVWIAGSPSARGVLSGNSREVKSALYRGAVVFADHPNIGEAEQNSQQDRENV